MNFKKIIAGVGACAMSMTLFGCELVSVNKERDNGQIVVSVGDKNYNKELVSGMANSMLSLYGINNAASKEYDNFRISVADNLASKKALQYYAIQNGYMDKLTDEHLKEIDKSFEETKNYYEKDIFEEVKKELGYTDEEGAPEFDEAAKERVAKKTAEKQKEYLLTFGVSSLDEYKADLKEQKAAELYTEYLESTVSVSDEEVKASYDSLLAEQKKSFDSNPAGYIEEAENGVITYTPAGLRRVKHVLIKIDEEASQKISVLEKQIEALEDGEEKTNKQSELDILKKDAFSKIEPKAKEVLDKAKSGKDFDSLIKEYGQDEGTKTNPDGYLMHANGGSYEEGFQKAGMALGKVGDISELVQTRYGYHIMLYASDVPQGEVAFDKVKDKIKEDTLAKKQEKLVSNKTTEILDNYKADGTVKIYGDRMKTASVPGKN